MASEIKVDTISEKTAGNGVTIDGVELKDGSVKGNGTGRKNYLINGNFDIWQRGTSLTGQTTDQYLADRWIVEASGATYSYQRGSFTVGQTDVPNNPKYFANITVTGADDFARITQRIEDVTTLSGETVTFSFYAKYTTNAPTNMRIQVAHIYGSGGSSATIYNPVDDFTISTSWQRYSFTFTVPDQSGKTVGSGSSVYFRIMNPNNEISDFQIAQVQVEKGSVATDFETLSIAETQSLCNRYYQLYIEGIQAIMTGAYYSSTALVGVINFEEMRVAPSIEVVTGTNYYRFWRNNTSDDFNDFGGSGAAGKKSANLQTNSNVSGTAGQSGSVWGNNANAKISLDAEL